MIGTTVQILAPKGSVALGKYRNSTGVFIIRQGALIVYVGWSRSLGVTCARYFGKGGRLEQYNKKLLTFEIILGTPRAASRLANSLKRHYQPKENAQFPEPRMTPRERAKRQLLLEYYQQNSRVAPKTKGSHKSDQPNRQKC